MPATAVVLGNLNEEVHEKDFQQKNEKRGGG